MVNSKFEYSNIELALYIHQLEFEIQRVNMEHLKFKYKIPESAIKCFTEYATKNKSPIDHEHIETLAFLVGYKENTEIIATDLIFPKQRGEIHLVEDYGKFL